MAEWNTRSAPSLNGCCSHGVVNVASTSKGTPASCAMADTRGMSSTSSPGLPSDSPSSSRVFGRIAARQPSMSRGLTKVVSMPKRGSVYASRLCEPPYSAALATMCEPAPAMVAMARCNAAWPLAVAMAPTPPSSAARRSSNTAVVGFEMRL